ncbi:MAG: TorD/DmsD family molecular chaperone [Bacteroidota bacterium]
MSSKQLFDIKLLKADIYRLLAKCFDFPASEHLTTIRVLADALSQTDYPDTEIRRMVGTLAQVINSDEAVASYSDIFIKGRVPLSETYTLQKFNSVPDVSAFYNAFGFTPKSGDTPDSIMYELEFMALLLVKTSTAPSESAGEICRNAYSNFLTEHLAEFSFKLAKRLRATGTKSFYNTVSLLLERFMRQEVADYK